MGISVATRQPLSWAIVMGVAWLAVVLWRGAMRQDAVRDRFDRLILRVRCSGPVLQYLLAVYFALSMEMMYASGIGILTAMRQSARTSGNRVLERAMLPWRMPWRVARRSIRRSLRAASCPKAIRTSSRPAKQSGNVDRMLRHIVAMAEEEVEHRLEIAIAALEPAMLWVMGCSVGVVIIATLGLLMKVIEKLGL